MASSKEDPENRSNPSIQLSPKRDSQTRTTTPPSISNYSSFAFHLFLDPSFSLFKTIIYIYIFARYMKIFDDGTRVGKRGTKTSDVLGTRRRRSDPGVRWHHHWPVNGRLPSRGDHGIYATWCVIRAILLGVDRQSRGLFVNRACICEERPKLFRQFSIHAFVGLNRARGDMSDLLLESFFFLPKESNSCSVFNKSLIELVLFLKREISSSSSIVNCYIFGIWFVKLEEVG